MVKLLVPSSEKESAVLHLMSLDLRHSVFVDIIVGLQ